MRVFTLLLTLSLSATARSDESNPARQDCSHHTSWAADPPAKPITPAEAAKKVNEKVTVEMEVKSTGGKEVNFLNSESDFKDAKNFTIFIPEAALETFKKAKIDDPKTYYKGKTVRVTGTVTLYREKPQIKVEDAVQIEVVEKK
jgi:DNA/RNA endonuclease YhcR with UshA esterase domain